jgi:mannose-1-phosphate guanylyltransferase
MHLPIGTGRRENDWAVILAGGDGTRLKSLTRRISGDDRPKQFCRILGHETLLEQTRRRILLEVAPQRTIYVVNRAHQLYYAPLLTAEPVKNLVIQPGNRGTAQAILYSLLRIAAVDTKAVVAFFPSDHYISDDYQFMAQMRCALEISHRRSDLVMLMGIHPQRPEVEYGWIEPAEPISAGSGARVFAVRRFWEKPEAMLPRSLFRRGCLWNSFVMVGAVKTLLRIIEKALPEVYRAFASLPPCFNSRDEANTANMLYDKLGETNFSHQVLATSPEQLAVSEVIGVKWNDLGEPKRVMDSLIMQGQRPYWADFPLTHALAARI